MREGAIARIDDLLEQALTRAGAGNLTSALECVDSVLELAPNHAGALGLKAALLLETGQAQASLPVFERAIALDPENPRNHSNRGNALARLGQAQAAIASYDRAIELDPAYAAAIVNRGGQFYRLNRWLEALADAARAIGLNPNLAAAHCNLGNALSSLGRPQNAVDSYSRALAINPAYALALSNRSRQQVLLERFSEALADADRAVALDPASALARQNQALALYNLDRHEAALNSIDAALALQETDPDIHALRGKILRMLGRPADCLASYERAVSLEPDSPDRRYERSFARLVLGDFRGGWSDYECRWRSPAFIRDSRGYVLDEIITHLDLNNSPRDVAGKRVLLLGEQGVGDTLMFASLISDLAAGAASVACVIDRRMAALFAHTWPKLRLYPVAQTFDLRRSDYDLIIPLGSLAPIFRNAAADFPGTPYLRPDPAVAQAWRERLGPKPAPLRVGLSWRGGLKITGTGRRSLSLEALRPLLARPDCEFVSLQYGDCADEVAAMNTKLDRPIRLFPGDEIDDFEQLAGLMQALDGVVSVQTAVIHLAGAVGAPCLAMIPQVPEWRYGQAGSTMPWYNSVRLFRQDRPDRWESVIEAVGAELDRRVRQGADLVS